MATATFKFNKNTVLGGLGDKRQRTVAYYGLIMFSAAGDAYAAGGIAPTSGFALAQLGPYADRTPLYVNVKSRNGSGWTYLWNVATGKLQIFSGNSSGSATTGEAELTAVALNTTTPQVATDVVEYEAVFPCV